MVAVIVLVCLLALGALSFPRHVFVSFDRESGRYYAVVVVGAGLVVFLGASALRAAALLWGAV